MVLHKKKQLNDMTYKQIQMLCRKTRTCIQECPLNRKKNELLEFLETDDQFEFYCSSDEEKTNEYEKEVEETTDEYKNEVEGKPYEDNEIEEEKHISFAEILQKLQRIYTLAKPETGECKLVFGLPEEPKFNRTDKFYDLWEKSNLVIKTYMEPTKYKDHIHNGNNKNYIDSNKMKRLKKKRGAIPSPGIQLEYPNLVKSQYWQEGRHRMQTAKNYGCDYVPVYLQITNLPKDMFKNIINPLEYFKKLWYDTTGEAYDPTISDKMTNKRVKLE